MFSTCDLHKKFYVAYVKPILKYISPAWNPTTVGLQKDLERVQRRFTKRLFVLGDTSFVERLVHLHLNTLDDRRNHTDLVIAYKVLYGLLGISKDSIGLQLQARVPTRSHRTDFVVHKAINNNVKKVFKYRISSQWNNLSVLSKFASSVHVFKKQFSKP